LHAEALSQGTKRRWAALERSGAVQLANIAFPTTFPAPLRPPNVSNTIVETSTPIRPQESALLTTLLLTLVFQEGCGAAPQVPTSDRGWMDYRQVHCEVPPPVPRLQQDVRWAPSISGDVHPAVMQNSRLGKVLAQKGLYAMVLIQESRLLTRHGVVAEDVHRPSA